MINKALIKSYADAAAVFAKARKPERGKPLDSLFRLMREKNERGDIYHLCWGTPRKLMATIHPDNTAEIYMPKGIPWYVFGRTLPTIIPFEATYSRKKGASVVIHTNNVIERGAWGMGLHEYYPGIRFNMETGACISTKPPPPTINKDRRKEWLRDLRVFKKQFELRVKLGVIDGLIKQVTEGSKEPRWALHVPWGTSHATIIFNDMKHGAPSTELLKLLVRHAFVGAYYYTPDAQHVRNSFNRVLAKLSTDLRKMYGVFDETETN